MFNQELPPALSLATLFFLCGHVLSVTTDRFCYAGQSCYPSSNQRAVFAKSINNRVVLPFDEEYNRLVQLQNVRETRFPNLIVTPTSTEEVQKTVIFARKFNLRMSIISSGHDYFGRSTWDGSLQMNMRNLSDVHVNLTSSRHADGEVSVGAGSTWLKVYTKLDAHDRVVVGGSAHTVTVGGYTLGGGHSPMSRMFGLAVDNLLEVELVLADGSKAVASADGTEITSPDGNVNKTTDSGLFWASRGGGGGTFGVTTKFTFKIHQAATGMVNLGIVFPMLLANGTFIGDTVLEKVSEILLNGPAEWGGYLLTDGITDQDGSVGHIILFFNHYGAWDTASRRYMDQLYNFHPEWSKQRFYVNYTSFLEYEKTVIDAQYYRTYVSNILMNNQSFTPEWRKTMLNLAFRFPRNSSVVRATGAWIGGKVHDVGINDTSVHPGFRESYLALTTALGWEGDGEHEDDFIAEGIKIMNDLRPYGIGSYRNEGSPDTNDWKGDFWGSNYDRLLAIKRLYDPDNVFTCIDCVGK
ncbi:VAO-type flavoprotein oxidase VAO615-like [Pecten maximus]|uniref:VAO-type flavoprotein oxidase VAO615-like n=1 Tax=Pecten maximus TaxID=6579 RepID=UPI001458BD72|nr:VAO-type flavoprotein oxidase VAO615-like [Pecten maximus]